MACFPTCNTVWKEILLKTENPGLSCTIIIKSIKDKRKNQNPAMQIVLFSLRWDKKVGHLQWFFLSVVRAYFMRCKVWQNFGAVFYQYHAGLITPVWFLWLKMHGFLFAQVEHCKLKMRIKNTQVMLQNYVHNSHPLI